MEKRKTMNALPTPRVAPRRHTAGRGALATAMLGLALCGTPLARAEIWSATAAADNWLSSCASGSSVNNGDDTEIRVRAAALWGDVKNFRSLLRFDVAAFPADARRISSVRLHVYYYTYHWDDPAGRTYRVHPVISEWDELGSTWRARRDCHEPDPVYWQSYLDGVPEYRPGGGDYDADIAAEATVPAGEDWMTWDITTLAGQWFSPQGVNRGLLIRDAEEIQQYVDDVSWGPAQFHSADYHDADFHPYLEVIYIGDGDGDGDVDLDDHTVLFACLAGPGVPPAPSPPLTPEQCLTAFDAEPDGDVDLRDVLAFQKAFGG